MMKTEGVCAVASKQALPLGNPFRCIAGIYDTMSVLISFGLIRVWRGDSLWALGKLHWIWELVQRTSPSSSRASPLPTRASLGLISRQGSAIRFSQN